MSSDNEIEKKKRLEERQKRLEEMTAGVKDVSHSKVDPRVAEQKGTARDGSVLLSEDFALEPRPKTIRHAKDGWQVRRGRRKRSVNRASRPKPRKTLQRAKAVSSQSPPAQPKSAGTKVPVKARRPQITAVARRARSVPVKRVEARGEGPAHAQNLHTTPPTKVSGRENRPAKELKAPSEANKDDTLNPQDLETADRMFAGDEWVKCPKCGGLKKAGERCRHCGYEGT